MMVLPMPSVIQRAVGSSSGSPARNSHCSFDRSCFVRNEASCFFSTRIPVGEENIVRTPYCSQMRHHTPGSGLVGNPSYNTDVAPAISGPYTLYEWPTAQPTSEVENITCPARTS